MQKVQTSLEMKIAEEEISHFTSPLILEFNTEVPKEIELAILAEISVSYRGGKLEITSNNVIYRRTSKGIR